MEKIKLLVVDDQSSVRKFLTSQLADLHPLVTEANNGEEALAVLAAGERFDLILTDIDMPKLDGLQLCARLKSDPATKAIPVIMISTFDSEVDIERGFRSGASAYISKAEVKTRLWQAVNDTLQKSRFRRKCQILLVDDSASIRKLVADSLTQAGFDVAIAENGQVAWEQLRSLTPDLILSDITMPEMDGLTLCALVRKEPRLAAIPFVAMSMHRERSYMKQMVAQGVASYIVKPFNMEELVILLDRILSEQFLLLLKEKEKVTLERDMMLASIASLISVLEARDGYTQGHSEKVAEIVTGMAAASELTGAELETLLIGAKLHDIGKVGVRDEILFKQGKLTAEEYEAIKTHPVVGATILEKIPSLQPIVPVLLHHHERYDGRGYPEGLAGEAIPLLARMVAVADTFDAMVSNRVYREGLQVEAVLAEIKRVSGTQLCPQCVAMFLSWYEGAGASCLG